MAGQIADKKNPGFSHFVDAIKQGLVFGPSGKVHSSAENKWLSKSS
ncbi:hypothetical protein IM774_02195 [Erysipelotrichaceae bacterium RD49]|nr:hypothetical protein [Erysipelotrichaceae bacterium RD49]